MSVIEMPSATEASPEETVTVLRTHDGARPEVRLVQRGSRRVVIKDFDTGSWVLRTIGHVLLPREYRAYQRLRGLAGIPECLGRDRHSITLEYVDGVPVPDAEPAALTPDFFARLYELVRAMHGRGVAHGDLKRLDNIMLDADGRPAVLDFSAAFTTGLNPIGALVIPYLKQDDLRAVAKAKHRHARHLLTPEEERFLTHTGPAVRAARRVLRGARWLIQLIATREHNKVS